MKGLGFVHRFVPGLSENTLLLLHGTGGDEDDLLPLGKELAPGVNLLSPRGPVLENGMPRFFRWLAQGVFDVPDLKRRTADLARFVAEAAQAYGFDPKRVYALGYSNGANIAAATLLLHPETLAGAALLRPMLPLEPETPPDLAGKPTFIAAGTQDPYSPSELVEALAERLRQAGAEVDLHWQKTGHGLLPAELAAAREWLARRLGTDPQIDERLP